MTNPGLSCFWRLRAALAVLATLAAVPVTAQVTVTTDDAMTPPANSLRSEVLASAPGGTIQIQIGVPADPGVQIDLADVLAFDNSVTLDNSSGTFGPVALFAPESGNFLEIQNGVDLTIRNLSLIGNGNNNNDDITLGNAASSLTFDLGASDQVITVNITGAGSFFKEGAGRLTLTGTNSHSGGTTIREGDLIGDRAALALSGSSPINLAATGGGTARLVFEIAGTSTDFIDGTAPTINHTGTDAAVLAKTGTGSFDLYGAMSGTEVSIAPTISLRVEQGQLGVANTVFGGARNATIDSGATLRFALQGAATATNTGQISGAGLLTAGGFGALTLAGDLSGFSGSLENASGVLFIAPSVAPVSPQTYDIAVNGLSVVLQNNTDVTYSGSLTGTGILEKTGTGIATLTGVSTRTGGTAVTGGTLVGSVSHITGNTTVTDGSTLRFEQPVDATFSGILSGGTGTATVLKAGAGALTFTNDITLGGNLQVLGGGIVFGRNADLTAANLTIGDNFAVNTTRKTLSSVFDFTTPGADNDVAIAGNLKLNPDSQLFVNLDATSGTATTFSTTGNIDIDTGAILDVQVQPGTYASGSMFTVLNAGAGFADADNFAIQESLFFLDITGAQAGNAYQLTLTNNGASLAAVGTTPNQIAVGRVLDGFITSGAGGDPDLQRVLDSLSSLQSGSVGGTLNAVAADDLSALTNVRLASAARTWRGLSNRFALHRDQGIGHHNAREARRERVRRLRAERLRKGRARPRRNQAAPSVDAAPPSAPKAQLAKPWVAWFEASGAIGELDSSDTNQYDYRLVGPVFGADTAITEDFRLGFAVAGTHSAYDVDRRGNNGTAYAAEGTIYGAYLGQPIEVLVGARYAHTWVDTDRIIQFGSIHDRIEAEYEGNEYGFFTEITHAFGSRNTVEFAPLASVAYTRVDWEDFDETGTNALRMRVSGDDIDSAATSLGLRIALDREMDAGFVFRPRVRAAWNHEWADIEREVSGQFAAGGAALRLEGAEMPRDHAEVGVGWEVGYGSRANLFADWTGRFGEDVIENALSIGVRAAW